MLGYLLVAMISVSSGFVMGGIVAGGKIRDLDSRLLANERLVGELCNALKEVRGLLEGEALGNSKAEVLHITASALDEADRITRS